MKENGTMVGRTTHVNAAKDQEALLKESFASKVIEHEGKLSRFEGVIENIDKNIFEIKSDLREVKKDIHKVDVDMIKMEGRIVSGYKKYFWMYVIFFATSLGITHHFEIYFKKLIGL